MSGKGTRRTSLQRRFSRCTVRSWAEAVTLAKGLAGYVFRGQASAQWTLSTTIERVAARFGGIGASDLQNRETVLLERFRRRAHHFIRDAPAADQVLEWLALMQ